MDIRPEYRKKSIRSYVVRAGRMTDGQRNAFENSWAKYGLKLADGPIDTDRPIWPHRDQGVGDRFWHGRFAVENGCGRT